jgi:2-keto-4-pentenoate hydratase/2-oxohepta-3-ene-1,7-dioic acid hydratase in catechol pathway
MRLAAFSAHGVARVGVVIDHEVHELECSLRDALVLSAAGVPEAVNRSRNGWTHDLDEVTLLAPLATGARVFCIGINYLEHQRESADTFVAAVPEHPIVFSKMREAIVGHEEVLRLPRTASLEFDWEVELAIVIGAAVSNVDRADAASAIAGYTVVNDVTARDLQRRHLQWLLAKSVDSATPLGPLVVTRDELGSEPDLEIELRVNGEVKQSARTSELIFGVPEIVSTISRTIALRPGDVIATGTPSGVGFKSDPVQYLVDGDVLESRVEGIGTLRNTIATAPGSSGRSATEPSEVSA